VLATATGLTLTLTSVWLANQINAGQQADAFRTLTRMKTDYIREAFHRIRYYELESLGGFFEGSENVTPEEFRVYVEHFNLVPEVQAWSWAPRIPAQQREAFEQQIRDQIDPTFQIQSAVALPDEAETPEAVHFPLLYLEPPYADSIFNLARGLDLATVDSLRPFLDEVLENGLPVATDLIWNAPKDHPDSVPHFLILRPVFELDPPYHLEGLIMASVIPEQMVRAVMTANLEHDLAIHMDLLELRPAATPLRLATTHLEENTRPDVEGDLSSEWLRTRPILAFGKVYAVSAHPTPHFFTGYGTFVGGIVLFAGLLVTLAAAILINYLSHRHEDMEGLVAQRSTELAASLHRYDQLALHSRTFSWQTDPNGLYTQLSEVAEQVLGYSVDSLVGKAHFYDLHPEEGRESFKAMAFEVMAAGKPFRGLINPMVTQSGDLVWVSTDGLPLLDEGGYVVGYQGTDMDITETRLAEVNLRKSEQKYRMLTENMKDVAWTVDTETFRFMYVSPSVTHLLGKTPQEMMELTLDAVFVPEQLQELAGLVRSRAAGLRTGAIHSQDYFINEVDHVHADGHRVQTEVITRYWLNEDTGRVELHGVTRDITDRKRAERLREMSMEALQILSRPGDLQDQLVELAAMLKSKTGFDAVGIRLLSAGRYPLVVRDGLACRFLDEGGHPNSGGTIEWIDGHVRYTCCCGLHLSGNTNAEHPAYTRGGACWINEAPPPAKASPDAPPTCLDAGYRSIAIIPVYEAGQVAGLLHFNDHRANQFPLETIQILENLAALVGEALQRKRAEQDYRTLFHEMLEGFAVHEMICDADGHPVDYRFLAVNPAFETITGLQAEQIVGRTVLEVLPQTEPEWIEYYGRVALSGEPAFFQQYSRSVNRHFEVTAFRPAPNQFACIFSDITERVHADAQLRESRRRYATLVAHLPGMAYRCANDRAWTMEFVSEGCRDLTGYAPEDLVNNQTIAYNDLILSAHRDRLWEQWQQALQQRQPAEVEYEITTRSGETKWVWEQGEGLFDDQGQLLALEGFITDISERKRAEIDRERLTSAIEQSQDTVVITDAGGLIRYVNHAFTKVTGYTREEAIGQSPRILQSGQHDREFYRDMWARLGAGLPWEGRIVNRRKNGELYTELASISPVRNSAGQIVHFVAVKRDITQQLLDQQERESLQAQLLQVQKMESIGRLAGGVAHDFNNMLQAILGYTEMALEQVVPSQPLHHDLLEIQKAARRSANLTAQLQAFARKQNISPRILDLNAAIENMAGMLRPLIGEHVEWVWKPGPGLFPIRIDPGHLDQILSNLCINAADAVNREGRIIIETRNVKLNRTIHALHNTIPPGEYVRLSVSDNGHGMDSEILVHIFEPFFTTKKTGRGTGLGLATVYGIVQQSHAFLRVISKPGVGSSFFIFFPCQPPTADLHVPGEPDEVDLDQLRGSETILIVEDEESLLHTTTRILESLGYRIVGTTSAREAIRLLSADPGQFDLVLSDVIMPELNGPELIQQLQTIAPRLKHVFMSGYTAKLLAEHGIRETDAELIQKPFSRHQLATRIRAILSSS